MSGDPGLLARLILPGMVCADLAEQDQDLPLEQDEAVPVAQAGAKRRRDFALGRTCAHAALERLGVPAGIIAMGPGGEPLWPDGIVGSITHTRGYAAAVVARVPAFRAIGVDAEQVEGLSPNLAAKLFGPKELASLAELEPDAWRRHAAIMFSAKEAYYKACLRTGPLPFKNLRVALEAGIFSVSDDAGGAATGRFVVADGLVVTLVGVTG